MMSRRSKQCVFTPTEKNTLVRDTLIPAKCGCQYVGFVVEWIWVKILDGYCQEWDKWIT